jgi:glycine hydroxymethyltransferase
MVMCKEEYGGLIDKMLFPGIQGGPLMHIIAAKALCFKEALTPAFKEYQSQIIKNAKALADELMGLGFDLVSGGTENHLLLVDLSREGISGREAEEALERAGIVVNKNSIPFDPKPPAITSGIRLGTPALTTRGMKEEEIKEVARMIGEVLRNIEKEGIISKIKRRALELSSAFPIYKN